MGKFTNLQAGGFRSGRRDEEEDPAAGLANLADCMLVLACGLMVALVVAWNIDISPVSEVTPMEDAEEVSNLEIVDDELQAGGNSYIDMGRVYQDPESGKMYVVEEDREGGDGADGTGGDAA